MQCPLDTAAPSLTRTETSTSSRLSKLANFVMLVRLTRLVRSARCCPYGQKKQSRQKDQSGYLSLATLLLSTVAALSPVVAQAALDFKPCELDSPSGGLTVRAECAILPLPEDPSDTSTTLIDVHVARLSATSSKSEDDPLLFIAGGPGQAASESWSTVQGAFRSVLKKRDIYLVDQRGTGLSNKLACESTSTQPDVMVFDPELTTEVSLECLESLEADPRFYSTSVAVSDLERVRDAIGVDTWNIYGVSYGSRVALHYLRRYPDRVRTLTLDAVVPPGVALGPGISLDAEAAFQTMLERCGNDNACNQAYPDLEEGTRNLLEALKNEPREISYENFTAGTVENLKVSNNHVSLTMRMMSYSSHGVSILPNMLHEAYARDNFAPFARQAEMQNRNLSNSMAMGMHNAVICTEDYPLLKNLDAKREAIENTYLGAIPSDALGASCAEWPAGVIDEDFHAPLESDKPVLILSGGADPVTPARYGELLMENMPNALHIINPFQGHMQVMLGCGPSVVNNFILRGNTHDVDYGCLERLRPEPFFINANGPRP